MATNQIYDPGDYLSIVADSPDAPASGDPVRMGVLTGVAMIDEQDDGSVVANIGPGVYEIPVDDDVTGGIAAGDIVYFHDVATGDPATALNNNPTGADAIFGIALAAVADGATTTILVKHVPHVG